MCLVVIHAVESNSEDVHRTILEGEHIEHRSIGITKQNLGSDLRNKKRHHKNSGACIEYREGTCHQPYGVKGGWNCSASLSAATSFIARLAYVKEFSSILERPPVPRSSQHTMSRKAADVASKERNEFVNPACDFESADSQKVHPQLHLQEAILPRRRRRPIRLP